jgi:hypothetical protein
VEHGELYNLKQTFDSKGLILAYSGIISQSIIEEFGTALKNKCEYENVSSNVNNRLFAIFVEQVQNVMKYSTEMRKDEYSGHFLSTGIVLVGKENNQFYTITGNKIPTEKTEALVQDIDHINSLSHDELKEFYRKERHRDTDVLGNSAGLGLVFIALKSSRQIDYHINNISDNESFFTIKAIV